MLKKSGFILLLAKGMAAMAQTVSGNVFCAGTTFDPSPASVSISGTVSAADVGLPGAIWVGIEDPGTPGTPAAFLTPSGWVTWTTGGFPTYVETTAIGSRYSDRNDRAVDSTPEASLEALFKNDWAACEAVFQATSSTSVQ